jgi:tRNA(Ile)-lysidine synthase
VEAVGGRGPGALPPDLPYGNLVSVVRAALGPVLPQGGRAGLAISGGPDSAGLALLVREARPDLDLVAIHVRHGLRDDEPDAAAAAGVAAHLGIPAVVRSVDVRDLGTGPEAAARAARHAALREVATTEGLVAVLLGHTAEDQAETVLLNLVRGAGLGGLAGMRPARTVEGLLLVRPLLALRRADVRAVPGRAGVAVVEDPTNDDEGQRRARARLDVLPALAALAGGPGDPVGALTRLADLAADDDAHLHDLAAEVGEGVVLAAGVVRLLRADALDALPVALGRRVARRALAEVRGGGEPSAVDVEAVRAAGAARTVGGAISVARSQGWITLVPVAASVPPRRAIDAGGAAWPELAAALVVDPGGDDPLARPLPARDAAAPPWLPRDQALALRTPPTGWTVGGGEPGATIRAGGRDRPLAEVLRAVGVPGALRALLPVVRDASGVVVWVPGAVVADDDGGAEGGEGSGVVLRLLGSGGATGLGYPPPGATPASQDPAGASSG